TELAGRIPEWLQLANLPAQPRHSETRSWVKLRGASQALLLRRRDRGLLSSLWAWLRRRPPASPEVRRAGLVFRLRRYGIRAPRLLAFGQRRVANGCVESFLLTEPPSGVVPVGQWVTQHAALPQRRQVVRAAAALLRRVHDLHYYLGGIPCLGVVRHDPGSDPDVVLTSIDSLHSRRYPSLHEAGKDLAALYRELFASGFSRTDGLRLVLSYLGRPKLNTTAKRLARTLLLPFRAPAVVRGTVAFPATGGIRLRTAGQGGVP